MFLAFVDAFTPWHLQMLKFFRNPARLLAALGKDPPLNPTLYETMARVLPIASLPQGFAEQVFTDLVIRSLVSPHDLQEGYDSRAWLHVITTQYKVREKRATPLGDSFLAFIESPKPETR